MTSDLVRFTLTNGVALVELDRASAHHALSSPLLNDLCAAIETARDSSNARVLVLASSGCGAFCAGGDIREMSMMSTEDGRKYVALGHACTQLLESLPFPTIAALHGSAMGGGLELAMACDILIAASTALLGLPEVKLGIIPGFGGVPRLVRRVGLPRASWMVLTGALIPAETALSWGLVISAVPTAEVRAAAMDLAAQFAQSSPQAVAAAKRVLSASPEMALGDALQLESACFMRAFADSDRAEGLNAFLERRDPRFSG